MTKPANIAKARERMTFKYGKTQECVMMAATIQLSLNNSEIDFLEENLKNCFVENQYFLGYFDGKRDESEDMLKRFLLISSTCFVNKTLHSKDLNHERFSKNGRRFLLFLTYFLPLSIRCGPCRDLIF